MKPRKSQLERLASFPQLDPNPIIEVDYSGKTTFVNAAAERLLDEIGQGKDNATAFLPTDFSALLRDMETAGEPLLQRETTIKGRVFELAISLAPAFKVARIYVRDITNRRGTDHELAFMGFALNHVSEEVFIVDKDARILFVNEAACRTLGYSKEELLGLRVVDIDPDFQIDAWPDHWQELQKCGFLWLRSRHITKEGRIYPVQVSSNYFEYKGSGYAFGLAKDITELQGAEMALQKSEANLTEAQRVAQIGSWEWDATEDTITWSKEYYRICGYDPDKPTPNYAEHLNAYTQEGRERLDAAVKKAMEEGECYELDLKLATPTSSTRWICARGEVIRDETGQVTGLRGTAQNITYRKLAEKKIARLNRMYAVLSRTNEEIIRSVDIGDLYEKACRILVEDGAFRMAWIGTIDEKTGMITPVTHFGYEEGYLEKIRISVNPGIPEGKGPTGTAIREGRSFVNNDTENNPVMLPWRQEALKRCYFSSTATPIKMEKSTLGVVTVYSDETNYFDEDIVGLITSLAEDIAFAIEHRRAEQEMAFLASVVRNVPDAICSTDTSGFIRSWNKAAERMFGYAAEEIIGRHITVTIPHELAQKEMDHLIKILNTSGSLSGHEAVRLAKAGTRVPVEITAVNMEDKADHVTSYVWIMRDITDKKKLEGQLLHAQKMEAIGTLAGGIAHDFNNILNIIIGYGMMVRDRLAGDEVSREQISEVLSAADRAANLTRRLLAFSRKQIVEMKSIKVDDIIAGMEKMISRLIGEDILFSTDLAARELLVKADTGQLEQVLLNLAANARDAMPDGGSLTVGTNVMEMDDSYILAHGYGKPGFYAVITVTDTGAGMDKETQRKIFEPYFTTKGLGLGTGLGLAIAFGIVKQHGGFIQVYSEKGEGTTFKILLPAVKHEASAVQKIEAATPVKGGTETILVAEDEPTLRKLMKIILESYGYTVITADNGEDAILRYTEGKDDISLVILDMIMPKKSGREAYDRIREISPGVKVIFASGYMMDLVRRQELLAQGLDFISKPIAPKDLLKKVREILDR